MRKGWYRPGIEAGTAYTRVLVAVMTRDSTSLIADDSSAFELHNIFSDYALRSDSGLGKATANLLAGRAGLQPEDNNPIALDASPNPFSPKTLVSFTVPPDDGDGPVDVSLYDMLGNKLLSVVKENRAAGHYVLTLDGTGLPAGSYAIAAHMLYHSQSKRILLLR